MKKYKEYKDSGVKWIGEIPSHWNVDRLRFLGTAQNGISKSGDYFGSGFPFVTYGDVYNNAIMKVPSGLASSTKEDQLLYSVEKGDIFFTRTSETIDEIGFSCVCLETIPQAIFSGFLIRFRPFKNELDTKFAAYYFRSKIHRNYFSKNMNIVIRASLGQTLLKNLPVLLPLLSEQHLIATYLDNKVSKIDKYISTAEKKIAALDELKQVTIADAVTHGVNPNVPMKDSGIPWIGMVPEHWEVSKIRSLFKLSSLKTKEPNCTLLSLSQYTGVRPKSECDNVGMFEAETTIGYNIVQKGQFVMNIMLAWNGSYSVSNYNGVISPAYCVFDFISDCDKKYFDYLLRLKAYSGAFKTLSKGLIDSRLRLYPNYFRTFPIVFPPVKEQNEIVTYIDRKVAQIEKMRALELTQIEKLKEYKQRLISDVVTGKVKVTND